MSKFAGLLPDIVSALLGYLKGREVQKANTISGMSDTLINARPPLVPEHL